MSFTRRKLLGALLALAGGGATMSPPAGWAAADTYPRSPVNLVAPCPAGGPTDALARVLADRLTKEWGQPVTVDNRPGGGGLIGAQAIERAAPDGYNLLLTLTTLVQTPHLHPTPPYDPRTAF